MVRGNRFVWQLLRIVLGFIAAVVFSGFFLAWGFFQGGVPDHSPAAVAAIIGSGLVTASVLGSVSLFPAVFAIGIAEALGLRGFIYHVGAAGVLAFALWMMGGDVAAEGPRPGSPVALAAGFVGGFVYWLIAGRSSGCWKTAVSSDGNPPASA